MPKGTISRVSMDSDKSESVYFLIHSTEYGFVDGYYTKVSLAIASLRELRKMFKGHHFSLNCIVDTPLISLNDTDMINRNYDIFEEEEFDIISRNKCPVIPVNCEDSYN